MDLFLERRLWRGPHKLPRVGGANCVGRDRGLNGGRLSDGASSQEAGVGEVLKQKNS